MHEQVCDHHSPHCSLSINAVQGSQIIGHRHNKVLTSYVHDRKAICGSTRLRQGAATSAGCTASARAGMGSTCGSWKSQKTLAKRSQNPISSMLATCTGMSRQEGTHIALSVDLARISPRWQSSEPAWSNLPGALQHSSSKPDNIWCCL